MLQTFNAQCSHLSIVHFVNLYFYTAFLSILMLPIRIHVMTDIPPNSGIYCGPSGKTLYILHFQ